MPAAGFALFASAIGHCGIAWNGDDTGLAGVLLPEGSEQATRACMQAKFPGVAETTPPAEVRKTIVRVVALLEGAMDNLADINLDMTGVPPFHQRVYAEARAISPGRTLTYGVFVLLMRIDTPAPKYSLYNNKLDIRHFSSNSP